VTRQEGWTEVWGGKDVNKGDANRTGDDGDVIDGLPLKPRYVTVLRDGCDYINSSANDLHHQNVIHQPDASLLQLSQNRVAWFEQIVLRMCFIPHTVENSAYVAAESTGSLPSLLDLRCGKFEIRHDARAQDEDDVTSTSGEEWETQLARLNAPVLLGRNHPGGLGSLFFHQFGKYNQSSTAPATANLESASFYPSGSHIVDYLRLCHTKQMNQHLIFPEHDNEGHITADMTAYTSLIQEKLNYIVLALRYGNDPAWEGMHRPQCIRASLNANGIAERRNPFFSLWSWYQTYSERTLGLYKLLPSSHSSPSLSQNMLALELFRYNDYRYSGSKGKTEEDGEEDEELNQQSKENLHQHHPFSSYLPAYGGLGGGDSGKVNVYRAMEYADLYYSSLERKLAPSSDTSGYFFGTGVSTYLDALLFAHLCEALCDVHLVLVLAKHAKLMRYFQTMYDRYFGKEYKKLFRESAGGDVNWVIRNNLTNARNAFNQLPEDKPTKKSSVDEYDCMTHAFDLMQKFAVHCHQLDEALEDAAKVRLDSSTVEERNVLKNYHRPLGSTLYKWCMGFWDGDRSTETKDTNVDTDNDDNRGGDDDGQSKSKSDQKRMYKEHIERMKRSRRTSDELWLSGVIVSVFVVLIVSSSSGKQTR